MKIKKDKVKKKFRMKDAKKNERMVNYTCDKKLHSSNLGNKK